MPTHQNTKGGEHKMSRRATASSKKAKEPIITKRFYIEAEQAAEIESGGVAIPDARREGYLNATTRYAIYEFVGYGKLAQQIVEE